MYNYMFCVLDEGRVRMIEIQIFVVLGKDCMKLQIVMLRLGCLSSRKFLPSGCQNVNCLLRVTSELQSSSIGFHSFQSIFKLSVACAVIYRFTEPSSSTGVLIYLASSPTCAILAKQAKFSAINCRYTRQLLVSLLLVTSRFFNCIPFGHHFFGDFVQIVIQQLFPNKFYGLCIFGIWYPAIIVLTHF